MQVTKNENVVAFILSKVSKIALYFNHAGIVEIYKP